jgi:hypothetical protein
MIWDIETGSHRATLLAVGDSNWVVTTPAGEFDASSNAEEFLQAVIGTRLVPFDRIRIQGYRPGLLKSVLESR